MIAKRGEVRITGVESRIDSGHRVYAISEPNALTQLIGWLKFTAQSGEVLYRGEAGIHERMLATGLRGRDEGGRLRLARQLHAYVDELAGGPCACDRPPSGYREGHRCTERIDRQSTRGVKGLVTGTYRAVIEPLLQHYGVQTRWLDVVDNVWVALWFACNRQVTDGRHAYHIRRSPDQEGADAKAYIAVLDTGELEPTEVPGYRVGRQCRLVDLRYAVPSIYLRPHAQHGLLIAPAEMPAGVDGALTDNVAAYIEFNLRDALHWLGEGAMTSPFVLFPPAARDDGYRRLLDYAPDPEGMLGYITSYGPAFSR